MSKQCVRLKVATRNFWPLTERPNKLQFPSTRNSYLWTRDIVLKWHQINMFTASTINQAAFLIFKYLVSSFYAVHAASIHFTLINIPMHSLLKSMILTVQSALSRREICIPRTTRLRAPTSCFRGKSNAAKCPYKFLRYEWSRYLNCLACCQLGSIVNE